MADTLLDMLRKKRAGTAPEAAMPFTPPGGSTEDLARHISEGSGRATTQGSSVSSVPEQVAAADASDQMAGVNDAVAARETSENTAAAGIEDASTRVRRETSEKAASISAAAKRQADTMLSEYENGRFGTKALGAEQDRAAAEQMAFAIRLGNDKYVNDLTNAATREMIQSDADFTRAFYEQEFKDSAALFGDAQAFRSMMAADQARFAKDIANMDLDDAISGYKAMTQQRKDQAPFAAAGAAIPAAATFAASSKTKPAATEPEELSSHEEATPEAGGGGGGGASTIYKGGK